MPIPRRAASCTQPMSFTASRGLTCTPTDSPALSRDHTPGPGPDPSPIVSCSWSSIAIKRLYVHESIHDAVCEELGRLARETVVGDGLEPGTQMGPIQNQRQFEKVKGFLEDARRNGKIV